MTKNQIEYAKLREAMRSNLAGEDLTRKRDLAARELGINTLAESTRHNQAVELLDSGKLNETVRSNLAKESETKRSNLARELETERHQKAAEAIDIGKTTATTASRAAELLELHRSNLARETETARHNLAMELKDTSPRTTVTVTPAPITVNAPTQVSPQPVQLNLSAGKDSQSIEGWSEYGTRTPGFDPGIGKGMFVDYPERSSSGRTRIRRQWANGKVDYIYD